MGNFNPMKKLLFLLLAIALIGNSCKKGCIDENAINFDPDAKRDAENCLYESPIVNLNFIFRFGGEELSFDNYYTDVNGNQVAVEIFRFYISDVNLVKPSGETYQLAEAELVDFDLLDTAWSNSFSYKIPLEDFSQLTFGVGLNSSINAIDPALYESSSPLSIYPGMYWTWATKYIFSKFEGKLIPNGQTNPTGIFYHTGLDKYYAEVQPISINLKEEFGEVNNLNFIIDMEKIFSEGSTPINYVTETNTHTMDNEPLAEKFLINLRSAITLE